MKKKTLISFVLLAIIGTSVVFAQEPTLDKLNLSTMGSGANAAYEAKATNKDISGAVVIPGSYNGRPVNRIPSWGFQNVLNITSVTIHEGVSIIGQSAFGGCKALTSVTIPASMTRIENYAFSLDVNAVTSVTFNGSDIKFGARPFPGDLDVAYQAGGAGTYTRPSVSSNNWTKQGGGFTLNGTWTRADGMQISISDNGQNITITGNKPNNGGRLNDTYTKR